MDQRVEAGMPNTDWLRAIIDPALAPLFARPTRTGVLSAWYGHVPFAHWIVAATRPRCLVELGSHYAVSYSAFCESVLRERLDTRCFAVDTWQGDDHAGFYGDEVFADVQRFHDVRYGGFSELLRCTFDEALPYMPERSVDLLHIDGRHGYEDVAHDFMTWQSRLSDRAVVLFHDTNVRERGFGVWRLFAELSGKHESFEFLHAHGLGVLAWGKQAPEPVVELCRLRDPVAIAAVRERFALLGERWVADYQAAEQRATISRLGEELEQTRGWGTSAQEEVNKLFPAYRDLLDANRAARSNLAVARHEAASLERRVAELEQAAEGERQKQRALIEELEAARRETLGLRAQQHAMLASRAWRLARRLRHLRLRGPLPLPAPSLPADVRIVPLSLEPPPAAALARPPAEARPNILFVSGEAHTPGHLYRVERMAAVARRLGCTADCMEAAPVGPDALAGRTHVILWRVSWSTHIQGIMEVARENGAAVLFDVDDLMFRPELATTDIIDGIRSQRFSELETQAFFGSVQRAMLATDIVVCTTEELAQHVRRLGASAMVVPNGFDPEAVAISRLARRNWQDCADGLLRVGYAAGSRTHQKDFLAAVPAVARLLRERSEMRLVLFRDPSSGEGVVLADEFPELAGLEAQIEWRDMVKLSELPREIARFDINLAPLELGNPFCDAKSELKYFEAALCGVPTVASPTGPFSRAIREGVTGFLAGSGQAWYEALSRLAADPALRARVGQAAYHDVLGAFGPEARARALRSVLQQTRGGAAAAHGFAADLREKAAPRPTPPHVPESELLFRRDRLGEASVTVIVPLYNYADYVVEALQSVQAQTVTTIDLVVVDDRSTDDSVQVALDWIGANEARFNRVLLLRHRENAGLGFARNSGFAAAETEFVLPLDADNRLRPECCARLIDALRGSEAAYAYPAIQQFGDKNRIFGGEPYSPLRLRRGNVIDAMALVRKWAWAACGGYDHVQYGWEDYDFWCRMAERGLFGRGVETVLAEYRVHTRSMLHTQTEVRGHKLDLIADLERRHPWLDIPTDVD